MSGVSAVSVTASSAKTVSGNSGSIKAPNGPQVAILAAVSAVSGTTPSMTLSVEWSNDGSNFVPADAADTFTAITATPGAAKSFAAKGEFFRLVWTITGTTPSFTFAATAYAA